MNNETMARYAVIRKKNPREIVLLRGSGCKWRRCRFCDYHLDFCTDERENFTLNRKILQQITGTYHTLEVINSGSFCDLDENTMNLIREICRLKKIHTIHFECHWKDRAYISSLRESFMDSGVNVKIKIGVETFDFLFRESYLDKGINEPSPEKIAADFDECCLLQGLPGQTLQSMLQDIETGLAFFERVCINIMVKNSARILPDPSVIQIFAENILPKYAEDSRIDILMENTDFGVGGTAL